MIAQADSGVSRFLKRVQVVSEVWFRFNLRAPFLLLFGASQKVRGKGKIDYYEKAGFASFAVMSKNRN